MKTLAAILHHNTTQYTDTLYELLSDEQEIGNYELIVIDNGSEDGKESKYSTYRLNENIYFGGALNAALELVNISDDYDSLLFLNNDLIVGKNFVSNLRKSMDEYDILSPCIIQPEKTQNHWKQMWSWGSNKIRPVKWIDLQCPFISKRFINKLYNSRVKTQGYYIDPLLLRGWGVDVWFGILCKDYGFKIGVCDYTPAIHLGSMTMKSLNNTTEYCQLAEQGMYDFFIKENLLSDFSLLRTWAEQYIYPEINK